MKEYMLEVTQRGHVFISGADSFEEAEELWKNSSVAGQFDIEWTNEKPELTGEGEEVYP